MNVKHPFDPVYDENSKILILGSFPSVKSREQSFFYGHPQNRFWKVIACICAVYKADCGMCMTKFGDKTADDMEMCLKNVPVPQTVAEKKRLLLNNGIAIWDVIAECDIEGSADSTIRNVKVNDIAKILENADIQKIFVNGKTAEKYYNKYIKGVVGRDAVCLPSTSPANAAWSLDRLVQAWGEAICK